MDVSGRNHRVLSRISAAANDFPAPVGTEDTPRVARVRPAVEKDRARIGKRETKEGSSGFQERLVSEWE